MTTSSQNLLLPIQQVFTNAGVVGSGYKVYTYTTGTTTLLTTYSDDALTIANTNPLVTNENGRFDTQAWVANRNLVKLVLKDSDGNVIQTIDPVDNYSNSSLNAFDPIPAVFLGTTSGTSTAYTLTSNIGLSTVGYSSNDVFLVAFNQACGASPTLAIDGLTALSLVKNTGSGTTTALVAEDLQSSRYFITNLGSTWLVLNPEHPANLPATTTSYRGLTYLPSTITISNNATTPNTVINFSAGVFQFSDGTGQAVATAKTKSISSTWVVGSGNGGLDTGSVAASTTYHCYAIYNPTTAIADFLFSTGATTPTSLPSGYTKYRRVGSIITNSSSTIIAFIQSGNYFELSLPTSAFSGSVGTSTGTVTLATPYGIVTTAVLNGSIELSNDSTNYYYRIFPYGANTTQASSTNFTSHTQTANASGRTNWSALVQTDSQSRVQHNTSGARNVTFTLQGYIDNTLFLD
jgi:hypothetical protein